MTATPGRERADDNRADRGARLLAATIDELILLAISLPMVFGAVPAITAMITGDANPGLIDSGDILHAMIAGPGTTTSVVALLAWCVITAWFVATNGQSVGKRIVGIKVVRTDGSRASFARIVLLRNVVSGLPTLFPYVGLLYQLIDPLFIYQESRRCLHDMLADTIVVRCPAR